MISFILELVGITTIVGAAVGAIAVQMGVVSITLKDANGTTKKFGKL